MTSPHTDWSPRWDSTFKDEWLGWLIDHRDEWTHPTDLFLASDELQRDHLRQCAYEAVEAARRLGFDIEGDRSKGYRFVGYSLPRYIRLRGQQLTTAAEEG